MARDTKLGSGRNHFGIFQTSGEEALAKIWMKQASRYIGAEVNAGRYFGWQGDTERVNPQLTPEEKLLARHLW